ncbi:hypothetical protein BDV11DRAFT_200442 [Aspergillus similis]
MRRAATAGESFASCAESESYWEPFPSGRTGLAPSLLDLGRDFSSKASRKLYTFGSSVSLAGLICFRSSRENKEIGSGSLLDRSFSCPLSLLKVTPDSWDSWDLNPAWSESLLPSPVLSSMLDRGNANKAIL